MIKPDSDHEFEPRLQVLPWKKVQARVHAVNAELAKALSALQNADTNRCVLASYPFGQAIVQHNKPYLPVDGHAQSVEFKNSAIPMDVQNAMAYQWKHYPLGVVLSHAAEVYLPITTHIAPLKVLTPGHLLGTYNILKTQGLSLMQHGASFSAGVKSLFMLPKLAHTESNQHLAKVFQLPHIMPCKTFAEQHHLFTALTESPRFNSEWRTDILLFSGDILAKIEVNSETKLALTEMALSQHQSPADAFLLDLVWSLFLAQFHPNNKQPTVIAETAKHLVKLMMGYLPGFVPAIDDTCAPVDRLMSIFTNVYHIRHHWPVFMQPGYYDHYHPIYYSLHNPAFLHPNEHNNSTARTLIVMTKLQEMLHAFKEYLTARSCPIPIANTLLLRNLNAVEIDLYHPEGRDPIRNDIAQMVADDPRFMKLANDNNTNPRLHFPTQSSFFHGCIRIRSIRRENEKPKIHQMLTPLRGMRLSKEE